MLGGIKALEQVIQEWRRLGAEAQFLSTSLGETNFPVAYVQERLEEYSNALCMAAGVAESNLMMMQDYIFLEAMRDPEP